MPHVDLLCEAVAAVEGRRPTGAQRKLQRYRRPGGVPARPARADASVAGGAAVPGEG